MVDSKDLQILAILNQNSKFPTSFIAKQVNLKYHTVDSRIKNLFSKGIIKFTHPVFYLGNLKLIRLYEVIINLYQSDVKTKEEIISVAQGFHSQRSKD